MEASAALLLASHARGTPRELRRLMERALDGFVSSEDPILEEVHVIRMLALEGYDAEGLSPDEQRYMKLLRGHPCLSLGQLARRLGKQGDAVRDTIEPFLLQCGLVEITERGRVATSRRPASKSAERSAPRISSDSARTPRHFGTVG